MFGLIQGPGVQPHEIKGLLRNTYGATLNVGDLVQLDWAQAGSGFLPGGDTSPWSCCTLAATTNTSNMTVYGIVLETIAANQRGMVGINGFFRGRVSRTTNNGGSIIVNKANTVLCVGTDAAVLGRMRPYAATSPVVGRWADADQGAATTEVFGWVYFNGLVQASGI
jgi:hypothetical protein